jgi:hypothetical protein
MRRLTADEWAEIRSRREAGESFGNLAKAFDISKAAITKKSRVEKWLTGQDIEEAVRRRVSEKVAGASNLVTAGNFRQVAEIIDAEAERRVEIELRHRQEWEQLEPFRKASMAKMKDAHDAGTTPAAKHQWLVAKVASEVAKNHILGLAAKQDAERRAYRLNDPTTVSATAATQIILEVPERPYEPAR